MRSILWYDWPFIYRHRDQLQSLDNALCLTRGAPLSWTQILFSIRPSDHVFTGVYETEANSGKNIGQVHQSQNMTSAYLSFLLMAGESDPRDMVPLLEGLIVQAGQWGAKQVVADLGIDSQWFPCFRQVGFSVLAKQRVYKCDPLLADQTTLKGTWRLWNCDDIPAMRALYYTLVPPLIQPIEPLTRREMLGLVYYDESGTLQAYADLVYGPVGVWVWPLFHPQTNESFTDIIAQMLLDLPAHNSKPIYVAARSYQPWVEHALEKLSSEPGPEQALMVRYLALRQRYKPEFSFAQMDNGKAEPTIPLAPIKNHRE